MTDTADIEVTFIDGGREPTQKPDPRYPDGKDIDLSRLQPRYCRTALPYPAPRCGLLRVVCQKCGYRAIITTAGRPDDPRSVMLPCSPFRSIP